MIRFSSLRGSPITAVFVFAIRGTSKSVCKPIPSSLPLSLGPPGPIFRLVPSANFIAVLAARNLRRGLALGLPSGQGMAESFGITPMSARELTLGLPAAEVALLKSQGNLLLTRTPLWYYILREAAVLNGGDRLGPVGARIVAETFVHILKRDPSSYLNPVTAMMTSKLKVKGSVGYMMRNVPTVLDFVRCAQEVTAEIR